MPTALEGWSGDDGGLSVVWLDVAEPPFEAADVALWDVLTVFRR